MAQNTRNLSISFLYHLPIYGQWATLIFQMITYNFLLLILLIFFYCNVIKKLYPLITKFSKKKDSMSYQNNFYV
jgi:hypothetical protein